jgi:hypothetical protein
VWDTATWETILTPSDLTEADSFTSVTFHPGGEHLFTQFMPFDEFWMKSGELWDLGTGEALEIDSPNLPRIDRGSVSFNPDGRMVVAAGNGRPTINETFTGRFLARLDTSSPYALAAEFSPDGSLIATAEADGTVRLWDAATAAEGLTLTGHTSLVTDVTFSPDGSRLASVGLDGTAQVWALDIEDLLAIARTRATRGISDEECWAFVRVGCPDLPGPQRLIPALSEWKGPFGIEESQWAAAAEGGRWTKSAGALPAGLVHTEDHFVHPESGRVLFFHDWNAVDWDALYSGESTDVDESKTMSWSVDLDSGEWAAVASMPPVPDWGMPFGTISGLGHHPGLDLIVAPRAEDGVTMGYDLAENTWSELAPANPAFADRYGYGLVHDVESGLLVRFGGAEWGRTDDGKHVGLDETWVFDYETAAWTEVSPPVSPPARRFPLMVYDAQSDRIILFGGDTRQSGEPHADTWVFDTNTNTWTEMHPSTSPPARVGAAVWYDPDADAMFLFGGDADGSSWPALPWMVLGGEELWSYDLEGDTWTLNRVDPNPGYRFNVDAGFDTRRGRAILVGGDFYNENRRYIGWRQDVWTYRHDGQ